MKRAIYVSKK